MLCPSQLMFIVPKTAVLKGEYIILYPKECFKDAVFFFVESSIPLFPLLAKMLLDEES